MTGLEERPKPSRSTAMARNPASVSAAMVGPKAAAKKFMPWNRTTVRPLGSPTGATSMYAIR